MDVFDLICHTAFGQAPLTRAERANKVKKRDYFTKYGEQARKVLETLLDKYADEGIENIEDMKILQVNPLNQFGSPLEIVKLFGGKKQYIKALIELEQEIYREVA
jgi:type I restriction enzyme R subunit